MNLRLVMRAVASWSHWTGVPSFFRRAAFHRGPRCFARRDLIKNIVNWSQVVAIQRVSDFTQDNLTFI